MHTRTGDPSGSLDPNILLIFSGDPLDGSRPVFLYSPHTSMSRCLIRRKLMATNNGKIAATAAGGATGAAGAVGAVAASGVTGLGATGITSGLAAVGSVAGGGMAVGLGICCAAPLALGAIGYGLYSLFSDN